MSYYYLKSLHLIFVITWFSGLFYIVRLFIYHTEAQDKAQNEKQILSDQFKIMQKRLWYGITWPSAILSALFGLSLIHNYFPINDHPWLVLKIFFLIGLFSYHFFCHRIFKELQNNKFKYSSLWLRGWNEVATIFLFAIVFLAITKSLIDFTIGFIGLVFLSILLFLGVRIYKKKREK